MKIFTIIERVRDCGLASFGYDDTSESHKVCLNLETAMKEVEQWKKDLKHCDFVDPLSEDNMILKISTVKNSDLYIFEIEIHEDETLD